MIYSTFSIVLVVFSGSSLPKCPLFRLLYVISSNQFPVVFLARRSSHFPNSWPVILLVFFCQTSLSQFFSLLDCFSAFVFQFFSFHYSSALSRIFVFLNTRHSLQIVVSQTLLQFQSLLPISSFTSLICYSFPGGVFFFAAFYLGFRLDTLTPSYSWDSVLLDWSSPSCSLLLPLAANFHYCQSSLTFPSTLYFPKSPIYNHFFTPAYNFPVAPRSVVSFRYFAEATFHFQFFQILIFCGALWCQTEGQIPQRDFFSHALNIYGIPPLLGSLASQVEPTRTHPFHTPPSWAPPLPNT